MLGVSEERSFTNGKPAPPRAERDPVKVAAGIGSREVEFSPLGVTREDLRTLTRFFLQAAGRIPPD